MKIIHISWRTSLNIRGSWRIRHGRIYDKFYVVLRYSIVRYDKTIDNHNSFFYEGYYKNSCSNIRKFSFVFRKNFKEYRRISTMFNRGSRRIRHPSFYDKFYEVFRYFFLASPDNLRKFCDKFWLGMEFQYSIFYICKWKFLNNL